MGKDVPLFILALTVCTYWGTVALLVLDKRLRHGQSAGVLPRQSLERRLWLAVVPVVAAWITLPLLACWGPAPFLALPSWAQSVSLLLGLRWGAAGLAVAAYALSLYCWLLLGQNWSMAVVPNQQSQLVTAGSYRWVRHPIYALSILLMLASVVVLPTLPMALLAGLHCFVMNQKARNEERHLQARFGPTYTRYCGASGRFWPRFSRLREATSSRPLVRS